MRSLGRADIARDSSGQQYRNSPHQLAASKKTKATILHLQRTQAFQEPVSQEEGPRVQVRTTLAETLTATGEGLAWTPALCKLRQEVFAGSSC